MIYIRDNGGAHSDWSIDFIESDEPQDLVVALLRLPGPYDGTQHKDPIVMVASEVEWIVGERETITLRDWWRKSDMDCYDDQDMRLKARNAAVALGLREP